MTTLFSLIKMLRAFFRVLICFKKLVMEIEKSDDGWITVWGNLQNSHMPEA